MNDKKYDISDISITLNVQSNVSYPTLINVLGNPYNPLDTSNATTQYRYDLSSFTFNNENSLSIQYRPSTSSNYSVFNAIITPSITSVVNALNTLGIGYFYTYTQSGSTYISTYNNNYVFGQLSIYEPSNTYVRYLVSQPYVGGSGLINTFIITQTYTSPTTIPLTDFNAQVGDTINVSGTTDSTTNTKVDITKTNNTNLVQTQIFLQTYTPLSLFSTSFVADAGYSYLIQITDL